MSPDGEDTSFHKASLLFLGSYIDEMLRFSFNDKNNVAY